MYKVQCRCGCVKWAAGPWEPLEDARRRQEAIWQELQARVTSRVTHPPVVVELVDGRGDAYAPRRAGRDVRRVNPRDGVPIRVSGIPALAVVRYYQPPRPWRQHVFPGAGPGDCDPPEYEDIEWDLYDRRGYPAPWLERLLDGSETEQVLEAVRGERYADAS